MGFHIGRGERETKKKNCETDSRNPSAKDDTLWLFFDRSVWGKMLSNTPNCPVPTHAVFLSIFSSPKQKVKWNVFAQVYVWVLTFHFLAKLEYRHFVPFLKNIGMNLRMSTSISLKRTFQTVYFLLLKTQHINMHVNWKWIPQKNHSANNGRQQKLIAQSTHNEEKDKHFFMLEIKNDVKSWAR